MAVFSSATKKDNSGAQHITTVWASHIRLQKILYILKCSLFLMSYKCVDLLLCEEIKIESYEI